MISAVMKDHSECCDCGWFIEFVVFLFGSALRLSAGGDFFPFTCRGLNTLHNSVQDSFTHSLLALLIAASSDMAHRPRRYYI